MATEVIKVGEVISDMAGVKEEQTNCHQTSPQNSPRELNASTIRFRKPPLIPNALSLEAIKGRDAELIDEALDMFAASRKDWDDFAKTLKPEKREIMRRFVVELNRSGRVLSVEGGQVHYFVILRQLREKTARHTFCLLCERYCRFKDDRGVFKKGTETEVERCGGAV